MITHQFGTVALIIENYMPIVAASSRFRSPPTATEVKARARQNIMRNQYATVIKAKECPACGVVNRIRYEFNIMMIEAPCSSCGAMVRWKRRTPGSGGQIRTAFEEDGAELVPLDR